jgi:hypothetical protein
MASTARPPSIGELSDFGYVRVKDQSPLPAKRDLVLAELNRILGLGLVQKLVVEVGQPITYERLIKKGETSPDLIAIETEDIYGAARNATMMDFVTEEDRYRGKGAYSQLFHAFQQLEQKGALPLGIIFRSYGDVRRWLGLSEIFDLTTIFGVTTFQHADIPEDVFLLVGSDRGEPDVVKLSIRIPMDLPKKGKKP